jgi:hypothetical protein
MPLFRLLHEQHTQRDALKNTEWGYFFQTISWNE